MFRALLPHLGRHRGRVALAAALLILAKAATVAVPIVLKLIVDRLGRPESIVLAPAALLLGYALLRFCGTLFGELRDLAFSRVSHEAMADFHRRAYDQLLGLSARFHARRETGRLARDVERGVVGVGFVLNVTLFTIVPTLIEIVAVMAILLANYNAWFTLILALTFAAYTTFSVVFTQRRAVHQRALNELDSRAAARLVDSLLNFDVIKAHASEPLEASRYSGLLGRWVEIAMRNQRALSTLHVGQSGVIAVGVAAVMLLAGTAVLHGAMTVGDLVLVNAYVIQVCLPLNALGFVFRQARDARVDAERLFALLEERPEVRDRPAARPLRVERGALEFERVSFAYEAERPVLVDVSFRVPAGGKVAVVGGSGSGKSTLARLLFRYYDVERGAIRIDGQDIREVTQESLRAALGIVPQDTVLFNDTIAHNIGYGREGASREQIVAAAKAAHVHELVASLPEAYDTLAGERGVRLSGGERQRLAIARVFLRDPPIVVFDEATSALDARAERAIEAELDALAERRTTLIIAHRLSSVIAADQILVLERGRIVERGRHAELLALAGTYAQLWALQRRERDLKRAAGELIVRQFGERRRSAAR